MIHFLTKPPTEVQVKEMLSTLGSYIKLAVDIRREILAGGGELHADCEAVLLEDGSRQEDIWGADWVPETGELTFEALINIRPRQHNPSMEILDAGIRDSIHRIAVRLLGVK